MVVFFWKESTGCHPPCVPGEVPPGPGQPANNNLNLGPAPEDGNVAAALQELLQDGADLLHLHALRIWMVPGEPAMRDGNKLDAKSPGESLQLR